MVHSKNIILFSLVMLTLLGMIGCSQAKDAANSAKDAVSSTADVSPRVYETAVHEKSEADTSQGMVFFDANSVVVKQSEISRSTLPSILASERISKITIIGHDDASGSAATAMLISQRRAASVKNYLVSKGLSLIHI